MCFNQNNEETIESLLERLIVEQINNADIWHRLGILYQDNMQHQEAINAFSIAIQLTQKDITCESLLMRFLNSGTNHITYGETAKIEAINSSLKITELCDKLSNIIKDLKNSNEAINGNSNTN